MHHPVRHHSLEGARCVTQEEGHINSPKQHNPSLSFKYNFKSISEFKAIAGLDLSPFLNEFLRRKIIRSATLSIMLHVKVGHPTNIELHFVT
jgi:hypothetical protein